MYVLQPSQLKDISNIAACHRICFKGSLSSKLGLAYNQKTFEWFLTGENRFLFHVIDEQGKVIGYCGGFCPQYIGDGSTSGIMQYAMKEGVKGALIRPWLLLNKEVVIIYPLILKNISRKLFKSKKKQSVKIDNSVFDKRAGLVVIGVDPDFRGKGVFELMMQQFEGETARRYIAKMVLSVKKENVRAIQAYKKQGWQVDKEKEKVLEMFKMIELPLHA